MDHSEKASCIVSKSCSMTTAANCRQRCTGLQLILILQYEKIWNKTSLSQVTEESHHFYYCSVTELLQSIFRPVTGFARERIIVCFNFSYFVDFSLYSFCILPCQAFKNYIRAVSKLEQETETSVQVIFLSDRIHLRNNTRFTTLNR